MVEQLSQQKGTQENLVRGGGTTVDSTKKPINKAGENMGGKHTGNTIPVSQMSSRTDRDEEMRKNPQDFENVERSDKPSLEHQKTTNNIQSDGNRTLNGQKTL